MAVETPICDFGWKAPHFELRGIDGKMHRLSDHVGERGLLVMFICNHCPYVKAVIDRIVRDAKELEAMGVKTVAICSNDAEGYPDDSFENIDDKLSEVSRRIEPTFDLFLVDGVAPQDDHGDDADEHQWCQQAIVPGQFAHHDQGRDRCV